MVILKRIHRNALSYVNDQRLSEGRDAIPDLPMGFRGETDHSPIEIALGHELAPKDSINDTEMVAMALAAPSVDACFVWHLLFSIGFYQRYDEARLYERRGLRRHQKMARALRGVPADAKEQYLRYSDLLKFLKKKMES
jgi:hypothetical protein